MEHGSDHGSVDKNRAEAYGAGEEITKWMSWLSATNGPARSPSDKLADKFSPRSRARFPIGSAGRELRICEKRARFPAHPRGENFPEVHLLCGFFLDASLAAGGGISMRKCRCSVEDFGIRMGNLGFSRGGAESVNGFLRGRGRGGASGRVAPDVTHRRADE